MYYTWPLTHICYDVQYVSLHTVMLYLVVIYTDLDLHTHVWI